jgi:phage tail sheath protein FI
MPVTPTYPGVYIEELPSGARPITGVATSIAAFIDFFPQGPVGDAVHVFGWPDFERQFGGLDTRSEASYAVQQFFLNGGTDAYVVRTTSSTAGKEATAAAIALMDKSGGSDVLVATAANPGQWGNNLRVDVDYGTTDPAKLFNLTIVEVSLVGAKPQVVASETFRNLSLDSTQPNFAPNVVRNGSQLATLAVVSGTSSTARPAQTGTTSVGFSGLNSYPAWAAAGTYALGDIVIDSNGNLEKATAVTAPGHSGASVTWPTTVGSTTTDQDITWQLVTIGTGLLNVKPDTAPTKWQIALQTAAGTSTFQADWSTVTVPAVPTWAWLAATLQSVIRNADASLANATVNVIGGASTLAYLQIKPGTNNSDDFIDITATGGTSNFLTSLNLETNVQQYALGASTAVEAQELPDVGGTPTAQPGSDGTWDVASDVAGMTGGLIGDPVAKAGMYALLDVDLFNILCIPATANLPDNNAAQVATNATALCTQRRAFYILDPPQQAGDRDTVPGIMTWLDQNATLRSRNAALYFPRPDIADPLNNFQLRPTAPSGTLAGVYARTDVARGVWKAPAGTEAALAGVQALEYRLIDGENGALNPLAINCLRSFPIYGNICWGARTLNGADQMADDYKYVPVRRLALYLEESLYRGLKWVVFEPNDEPLWAQIRLNVTGFMQNLFRQGAFQGGSPQQAYFVKCDSGTTTPLDQANGIVNIVVGFAPLKPAEFVIIQIQQIAGQLAS